jgi:cytochrome c biogenesis factor
MVVELGHYALMLALLLAAAQAFFGLAGPALGRERWLAVVPSAAAGQFVFLLLVAAVLVNAFVQDDFSVRYVAENSNSALLPWILVLSGWTMAVAARRDVALKPGQTVQLSDYRFRYDGVQGIEGSNYEGVRGTVSVTRDGKPVTVLHPQKRRYWVQGSVQTTAAIAPTLQRDLLASLGDDVGDGAYSLRLQYRPLIRSIWLWALIMAIAGALSPAVQPQALAREPGGAR